MKQGQCGGDDSRLVKVSDESEAANDSTKFQPHYVCAKHFPVVTREPSDKR